MRSILALLLLICLCTTLRAQSFSDRTNMISVDVSKDMQSTTLPQIVWLAPKMESSVVIEGSYTIEVDIETDMLLKEVTLQVKYGDERIERKLKPQEGNLKYRIKQYVQLQPGNNELKIIAENKRGAIVSSTRYIRVGRDAIADAVDANRKDYALIFATDAYDNWTDLVNPISDARTIETILKEKYGFETEIIENATLEELSDKIYDYNTKKFNPQDQLFIFFAGHGYFDDVLGEGYIVTSNSLLNDKGKNSYLSHTLLRQRLDNIKCEHIFLSMDICFGGTFDPVLAKTRSGELLDETSDTQYLVRKLSRRTRKFLTSGSKEYVSDGIPGKHSPFAAKFIQALRETGGGTGRLLTLSELNTYFQKLATEARFGSFGSDDPASDFVFVSQQ